MALPHTARALGLSMLSIGVLSLSACIDPQVGVRRTQSANTVSVPRTSNPVSGVSEHIVQKGDTLYAIAFRYALDFRDIARWNGISEPYIIKPDQHLMLRDPSVQIAAQANSAPTYTAPSTAVSPTSASVVQTASVPTQVGVAAPTPQGVSVGSTVADAPLATVEPLSPTNAEGLPTGFVSGNSSAPPSTAASSGTRTSAPAASSVAVVSSPAVHPNTDVPTAPPPELMAPKPNTVAVIQAPTLSTSSAVKPPAGANGWGWPVIGRVLTTFSGADPGRQGVDISGNLGDPVHAAKGGDVVYSGRGIIGYGELIVIKHDDATLTAYGHNAKRAVKEGERVAQGQKIAEMGRAPNGQSLLHFEVRRNGKPIDPLSVLPARR